jgi:hypothetical protein
MITIQTQVDRPSVTAKYLRSVTVPTHVLGCCFGCLLPQSHLGENLLCEPNNKRTRFGLASTLANVGKEVCKEVIAPPR